MLRKVLSSFTWAKCPGDGLSVDGSTIGKHRMAPSPGVRRLYGSATALPCCNPDDHARRVILSSEDENVPYDLIKYIDRQPYLHIDTLV